jgi:hypothetical protein
LRSGGVFNPARSPGPVNDGGGDSAADYSHFEAGPICHRTIRARSACWSRARDRLAGIFTERDVLTKIAGDPIDLDHSRWSYQPAIQSFHPRGSERDRQVGNREHELLAGAKQI